MRERLVADFIVSMMSRDMLVRQQPHSFGKRRYFEQLRMLSSRASLRLEDHYS